MLRLQSWDMVEVMNIIFKVRVLNMEQVLDFPVRHYVKRIFQV